MVFVRRVGASAGNDMEGEADGVERPATVGNGKDATAAGGEGTQSDAAKKKSGVGTSEHDSPSYVPRYALGKT